MGATLASAALARSAAAAGPELESSLTFRLKETAGLRRFGYPVHTVLPEGSTGARYRLEQGGKPVPAQFREVSNPGGKPAVSLDFNASLGPLETQAYTVQFGEGVAPVAEPRGGMNVSHKGGNFFVSNGSALQYTVPETLGDLVVSVKNARLEFIGETQRSCALMLTANDASRKGVAFGESGRVKASITRQGPLAVGLRFEEELTLPGGKTVRAVADLTFPNSKSWVETTLTVDDPEGLVRSLTFQLPILVEGEPTLVDLGASNTVYGTIKGQERMVLLSGREPVRPQPDPGGSWVVFKGDRTRSIPQFAVSKTRDADAAEGWAHVMDRRRCTAIAVADFARGTRDTISVEANGLVEFFREYVGAGEKPAPEGFKGTKTLRYWAHFVTNPVQIGALTSPQAMLAPLSVDWEPLGT
jgi:hypothetical protein